MNSVPSRPGDLFPDRRSFAGDPSAPKHLFVFLDGTKNNYKSQTNVRRLYEALWRINDPQAVALYLEGVGTARDPLLGPVLGHGMEERVLNAYLFLAEEFRQNDCVHLFGFSRGAHEARALAGLLSYAGIPAFPSNTDSRRRRKVGNGLIDRLKAERDADYTATWQTWTPQQAPPLAEYARSAFGTDLRPVQMSFLGLWDTVPGSSFKRYASSKEDIGFWKRHLSWLPMISAGERYKTDSYPPVRRIVHAVALDEKRSKFAPLLLCPPIRPDVTIVSEVWFPGAHADVGGGYDDAGADGLPGLSLNWVLDQLVTVYPFDIPRFGENASGLAHWSIGDHPGNIGSEYQDRQPPAGAIIHRSYCERSSRSEVPIQIRHMVFSLRYPVARLDVDQMAR